MAAPGIMIVTLVDWYHAPTGLKAMIDRLVRVDGLVDRFGLGEPFR